MGSTQYQKQIAFPFNSSFYSQHKFCLQMNKIYNSVISLNFPECAEGVHWQQCRSQSKILGGRNLRGQNISF